MNQHRENAFQAYLEATDEYFAAVEEDGDTPWHEGDEEVRRELWMRRYTRPAPPVGLTTDLAVIRRDATRYAPITDQERELIEFTRRYGETPDSRGRRLRKPLWPNTEQVAA